MSISSSRVLIVFIRETIALFSCSAIFCFSVINDPLLDKIIPKYLYSVFISISSQPKKK